MASELSALSTILPTMVSSSSSKVYPIATSQYDRDTPADVGMPPVQSLKRKVRDSMRGSSPPAKREKATKVQHTFHQVSRAEETLERDSVEVIRRSCSSTSVTHHTLRRFKSELEEAERTHQRAIAEKPDNPILPETGKPRFTFSAYQMKPPTEVLVEVFRDEPERLEYLANNAQFWRGRCMLGRLRRQMCLRDWEWSVGEPERLPSDHAINESAKYVKGRKRGDRPALDVGENNVRFAERVEKFTYTRKEDPTFRGKKVVLREEERLKVIRGNFANEVDDEDFVYDTDFETTCRR